MIVRFLTKKPILMIGILCMIIFMFQLQQKGILSRKDKVTPYSCRAVLVKLDKIIEKWAKDKLVSSCDKNNLKIKLLLEEIKLPEESDKIRAILYRELANTFFFVAKHSPFETLQRTATVRVDLLSKFGNIVAIGMGDEVANFATLTDEKMLAAHLQKSITVKEELQFPEQMKTTK